LPAPTRKYVRHVIIRFTDGTEKMAEFPDNDVVLASTDATYWHNNKVIERKRQHKLTWEEDYGEDTR